ncbi:MAG TPA: CARDB domain-containing protein [Candidatus Bathyarchaeia archaeon]|nr:CARDB domain-containing protein [Candidatus Bathyarchaeia archaeon]
MDREKPAVSMAMFLLLIVGLVAVALGSSDFMFNRKARAATGTFSIADDYFPDTLPPPTEWNKTFGGAAWDVANSVIETNDGGFMLAGWTQSHGAGGGDFWLVKTNSAGRALWNRTYGGADYDEAHSVILSSDGGYALAGVTRSYGAGVTDFWLVKTDSNGNHQWNQTYGGAGYDYLFSAIRTSDDGYALAGYTESYGQGGDFWLVKTDVNGIMQWSEAYGGRGSEEARSVIQTSDGGYALAGETDPAGAIEPDFWWVKTAADGRKQRDQSYGGVNPEGAYSLVQTSDGDYALAGYTESWGNGILGYPDFWLVRIDSMGRELWTQAYGGLDGDSAESLIILASGGYAIAGATLSYGAGYWDSWLITVNSAGNLNWSQTYGGVGYDFAYSMIETSDRGFALAGDTFSYGGGSGDMWLVKVEGSIPRHDVAVINCASTKTVVGQGYSALINVTVENQGNRLEMVNVTVYANTTVVDALSSLQIITPGGIQVLSFTWTAIEGEFPKGNYALSAETVIPPPTVDADPTDNLLANGLITVSLPGDLSSNGRVDVFDLYRLGRAFASTYASSNWNADCDIDSNGTVDSADLSITNENYGKASR